MEKLGNLKIEVQTDELPREEITRLVRESMPEATRDTIPVKKSESIPDNRKVAQPPTEVTTDRGLYINVAGEKIVWVEGEDDSTPSEPNKKKSSKIYG